MSEVKTKHVIDDMIVNQVTTIGDLTVYTLEIGNDDDILFFFADKKGVVKKRLKVSADCGQNTGFIDDYKFY